MSPARWQQLKTIVADALEKDSPVARAALVSERCADDDRLRQAAESLLRDAETTLRDGEDALEQCAETVAGLHGRDRFPQTGQRIGAYIIVKALGHGGMGSVYLAARADGYFEKQVAIKVLEPTGKAGDLVQRFRAEREALASLDHPNIAGIFDAGTTDNGLPYYVMEYVPGQAVTTFVAERQLSIRERLELFLKICAGVEAAHRRRIVHRDLKPGNILVSEDGEPKLLDFGIAKLLATDSPLEETATGQQRLTPICASPEQAMGDTVTTASDIYALGTLLYEMSTGQTPHRFPNRHPSSEEVTQVICEQATLRPSEVVSDPEEARALRGELDAIVLLAMHKEPGKRYSSVSALAADIRRYLAAQPVQALPQTKFYRLRSLVRRNKLLAMGVILGVAAVLCIFALVVMLARRDGRLPNETGGRTTVAVAKPISSIPEKSIAVLPFADLSPGHDQEYFSDGMAEEILDALAQVQDLKVSGRTSSFYFKGRNENLHAIGEALGVANILEGSVRKQGDKVRISVELIQAADGFRLWSESYDGDLSDVFELQERIARAVVDELKVVLQGNTPARLVPKATNNIEAHQQYLRGRYFWNRRGFDNLQNAVTAFKAALAADPDYVDAWAGLAQTYALIPEYSASDPAGNGKTIDTVSEALDAADHALRLDPVSSRALSARAYVRCVYQFDWARAEADYRAALASDPRDSAARHWYGELLMYQRRWPEAAVQFDAAIALDPLASIIQVSKALSVWFQGDPVAALPYLDESLKLVPGFYYSLINKAVVLAELRRFDEAMAVARDLPEGKRETVLSFIEAMQDPSRKEAVAQELSARGPTGVTGKARMLAILGQYDLVLNELERLFAEHDPYRVYLYSIPEFDPLHQNPRFQALLKEIGLPIATESRTTPSR